eukprot:9135402-Prorocentrum_lima.AAC.1
MSLTPAIAPIPVSPHARRFTTGGTTWIPLALRAARCSPVMRWWYMSVFIAGATSTGRCTCGATAGS